MKGKSTSPLDPDIVKLKITESLPGYDCSEVKYESLRHPVYVTCRAHGRRGVVMPKYAMGGRGSCGACDWKPGKRYQLDIEEYVILASELHSGKYDYGELTESNYKNDKIPVVCPTHGRFMIRRSAHISPTQLYGCQKCGRVESKGEISISNFLTRHGIHFLEQYSVPSISKSMFYDFYLPEERILIEYDGQHHFKPVKFSKSQSIESAERKFETIKYNDGLKNKVILTEDVRLIRIFYTRFFELEDILTNELLGGSICLSDAPVLQIAPTKPKNTISIYC